MYVHACVDITAVSVFIVSVFDDSVALSLVVSTLQQHPTTSPPTKLWRSESHPLSHTHTPSQARLLLNVLQGVEGATRRSTQVDAVPFFFPRCAGTRANTTQEARRAQYPMSHGGSGEEGSDTVWRGPQGISSMVLHTDPLKEEVGCQNKKALAPEIYRFILKSIKVCVVISTRRFKDLKVTSHRNWNCRQGGSKDTKMFL